MVIPRVLFMRHLKAAMVIMSRISMRNSSTMEHRRPSLDTSYGFPLIAPYNNQGSGNLFKNKNMFKNIISTVLCRKAKGLVKRWLQGTQWAAFEGEFEVQLTVNKLNAACPPALNYMSYLSFFFS